MHPPPPPKKKQNKQKTKKKQITNKCLNICELVEWQREIEITPFLSLLSCETSMSVKKKQTMLKFLLILVSEYAKLLIFCFLFVCVIFKSPCNLGLLQGF